MKTSLPFRWCSITRVRWTVFLLLLALSPATLSADTYFSDFNSGQPAGMTLFGQATVSAGYLQLTTTSGCQFGIAYIDDFSGGYPIQAFRATFKASLFGSTCCGGGAQPADGFSFNLVPAATALPNPGYGQPAEEGLDEGLAVNFDTWDNGFLEPEAPAIEVKWMGVIIARAPFQASQSPAGAVDPVTASREVVIDLKPGGAIDVSYGGTLLLNNVPTPYCPGAIGAPKWVLGARICGANDNHWIDDLRIVALTGLVVSNNNDSGPGSLRQIIEDIEETCSGGRVTFAANVTGTITLSSGELVIAKDMIIKGPGPHLLTISGNASRVFHITGGASQISDLRIANGHASAGGGGIAMNGGSLTVSNCTITGCYAQGVDVASQGGGAIAVVGTANLAIIASTLSSNTTPYAGGGLYLFNAPTVSLINSTVSGCRTLDGELGDGGGGIYVGNGSTLNVSGSTIANNSTVVQGGGVYKGLSGIVRVGNSLIAGNSAGGLGPDCKGTFVSAGYNLLGNSSGSTGFGATGDQLNLNAQIGALADNGGPTFTHALLTGSPAIDKGHNFSFGTDQRGGVRIVDSPNISNAPGGDGSDIGAVEAGGYLRITDLRTNGPQVNISFTTDPGLPYSLESKDALVAGPWTLVPGSTRTGNGAVLTVPDTRPRVPKRFYRAVMTAPTTQVVYVNNFEGAVGAEWSVAQAVSTTPVGGRSFLGEFASTVVTLQLANLPSHMHLSVSFDLFILKSWDGNRTDFGPDRWTLSLRGGATLVDTTFTLDPAGTQAYPGAFGANYPGLTGAAEHNTLGYAFGMVPSDSVYRLTATFNHTASSVTLDFSGVNLQDLADESWGLDNVRVETVAQP